MKSKKHAITACKPLTATNHTANRYASFLKETQLILQKMKKPSITLGYFAVFFTALYTVIKYSLLPGANVIMIIAGIIIAIYLPLVFLNQISKRHADRPKIVDKFGALLLSLIIISVVLRFNDWSLMGFKGDQVIRVFTLPSWIYVVPYLSLSLIYVPWPLVSG